MTTENQGSPALAISGWVPKAIGNDRIGFELVEGGVTYVGDVIWFGGNAVRRDDVLSQLQTWPKLLGMLQRYDQLNYSPCLIDHNGDCQEHYMERDSEGCTVKLGRELLDEIKEQVGGAS